MACHGRGTAQTWHVMCESALRMLKVPQFHLFLTRQEMIQFNILRHNYRSLALPITHQLLQQSCDTDHNKSVAAAYFMILSASHIIWHRMVK
jgi:hypothetical protein